MCRTGSNAREIARQIVDFRDRRSPPRSGFGEARQSEWMPITASSSGESWTTSRSSRLIRTLASTENPDASYANMSAAALAVNCLSRRRRRRNPAPIAPSSSAAEGSGTAM